MRTALVGAFIFVAALAHCQGFNKRYDAFNWGYAQSGFGIERLPVGFVVLGGSSDYDSIAPGVWQFHASALLTWLDANGLKTLEKRSWRPDHSAFVGWANCCDIITGDGFVVGGSSEDSLGNDEVYLMRFDAQGDTLWTKVFGDSLLNYYYIGRQVKRTADGGFLIAGDMGVGDLTVNGIDGFAIKTDSLGNEQWRQTYGGPPPDWRAFISTDIGPSATYYLGGSFYPVDDDGQHWVVRVDAIGNELWSAVWGGPFSEGATQVVTAADGHPLVFSGRGYALSYAATRPYIAKLDSTDGSVIWEREYGPMLPLTVLFAGKECPNGDLIAAGGTYVSQAPNNEMGLLLRTTSTGDSLWMFTYHYQDSLVNEGQGRFYDVMPTADGGFIAAGVARNPVGSPYPPNYSQDTWVVKVDSLGCILPGCNGVGIAEQVTNLADALTLYPNPVSVNGQVIVELTLPTSVQINAPLRLVLTSMQGQLVKELSLPAQHDQRVVLDVGGLAAGLYSVHIADGGRWLTGAQLVVADP